MPQEVAHFSFLPWLRRGLSRQINEVDTLGLSNGTVLLRPQVTITLHCDIAATDGTVLPSQDIAKSVQIMSPGDINGIQSAAIVRTEPPNGACKFESNSLPYIEFYEEDFAWRYTPAKPVDTSGNVSSTKLRPWIFLVVLEEDEYEFHPATGDGGPSYITVNQSKFDVAFPHHEQIWAWAHVHMSTNISADNNAIAAALDNNPDIGLSRILSPRKLKSDRSYHAFLIPTFESGRLAGLGIDPPSTMCAQTPAWKSGVMPASEIRPFDFPVYYHWNFTTGTAGDFESCVRSLTPTHDTGTFAGRPMSIGQSGYGFDTPANETVLVEGALKPVGYESQAWPVSKPPVDRAGQVSYQKNLKMLLNAGAELQKISGKKNVYPLGHSEYNGDDPIVTPPIYGSLHRNEPVVGSTQSSPWIDSLNLMPQNRVVAGLGAQNVRDNQDDFMEKAWMQIDQVTEANKRLQQAQLASETLQRMHEKHIASVAGDQDVIMRMSSVLSSIRSSDESGTFVIAHELAQSRIPQAALSPAFRRMLRPSRKVVKRMESLAALQHGSTVPMYRNLYSNFNKSGSDYDSDTTLVPLTAAKSKRAPVCAIETTDLDDAIVKANEKLNTPGIAVQHTFIAIAAQISLPSTAAIGSVKSAFKSFLASVPADQQAVFQELVNAIRTWNPSGNSIEIIIKNNIFAFRYGKSSTGKFKQVGAKQILVRRNLYPSETQSRFTEMTDAASLEDYAVKFKSLSTDLMGNLDAEEESPKSPFTQTQQCAKTIVNSLHPHAAFYKRFTNTVIIDSVNDVKELPGSVPVQAYPVIDEPAFPYLAKQSRDWIIPNVDKVPFNSVMVLESNQKFIEAYCAGFNYEFARELLWNEYPTDLRVSSMRSFWDVKDNTGYQTDVKELHLWDKELGKNNEKNNAYLVMLVRGDLLKKYPNTIVYMQQAMFTNNDYTKARKLNDASSPVLPLFSGELNPDIAFFGFNISSQAAKGKRVAGSTEAGYFFVFKERPGQVHFGMDDIDENFDFTTDAPDGNGLSWGHLVNSESELDLLSTIDLARKIRIADTTNGDWLQSNSATIASTLLQNPVMFARHADTLI